MKIYVSHSLSFDFVKELYEPLQKSALAANHQFIFPHDQGHEAFPSKKLFADKACDLVLAEVSFPSTGQGIELGWADSSGVKIVCASKKGTKISGSLGVIVKDFLIYKDSDDLVRQLLNYLSI
jgi:hypothetical protein